MEITKIVITGGPCAGKTTAMSRILKDFSRKGYTVLFVPETATELITGGVAPWTCGTNAEYQVCQMQLQLEKERIFEQAAVTMPAKKILIVCDRGAMDNRAYMTDEEFSSVLSVIGQTEAGLRDSYDAVFHLVSAAKGAEQFYTVENNSARTETVEQAAALDDKILSAWQGHPHHRVVGNAMEFEDKMNRLVGEITAFLGEPDPFEFTRKYLIEFPDTALLESLPNCRRMEIVQTYLYTPSGEESYLRKRSADGNSTYFHTAQRPALDQKRIEVERRLSKNDYKRLLSNADPACRPICKTRYCLNFGEYYCDIDVYPFWNDKAIMEMELSSESAPIHFPEMVKVIREVTNDEAYRNTTLAKL